MPRETVPIAAAQKITNPSQAATRRFMEELHLSAMITTHFAPTEYPGGKRSCQCCPGVGAHSGCFGKPSPPSTTPQLAGPNNLALWHCGKIPRIFHKFVHQMPRVPSSASVAPWPPNNLALLAALRKTREKLAL